MFQVTAEELGMISQLRHPQYQWALEEWTKWRLTMAGGKIYLDTYLQKFSEREDDDDFLLRKKLSYCSSYSKSSVWEIINAIFQRMRDITRDDGPDSYINAVAGRDGGVNREGMSMNMFMGRKVLPELLSMGKVGVYVDMANDIEGTTLADTADKHPYFYHYAVEDILNWNYTDQELRSVLLRDLIYSYDEKTGMPNGTEIRYRYIWQAYSGEIYAIAYTGEWQETGKKKTFIVNSRVEYQLNLKRIPFVIIDIGQSLLTDIADHQNSLTNLESSDINFLFRANFPIYTEQQNNKIAATHQKKPGENDGEIVTGAMRGRTYPLEAARPDFIHPSPEPLKASMLKEDAIKTEIRHLIHLAVSKLTPQHESAASKSLDNEGLEAGLAFIGLTLEHAENFLAQRWTEYLGGPEPTSPTVKYPSQYSLVSDTERRSAAKDIFNMRDDIPSTLGRKELVKLAVQTLFDGRVSPDTMDNILNEIDSANYVSARPDDIERDVKNGLVSKGTASVARGYDVKEAPKANDEYIQRLKFIADTQTKGGAGGRSIPGEPNNKGNQSQTDPANPNGTTGQIENPAARGVPDLAPAPIANAQAEKQSGG